MTWRVEETEGCHQRCDACRRDGRECAWRWQVVDDNSFPGDGLVADDFESREEAEAYIVQQRLRSGH
jgi:hypothetical protein